MDVDEEGELTPERIQAVRLARGDSTAEFADAVGTATRTVQKWEAGDAAPSSENQEAIWSVVPTDASLEDLTAALEEGTLHARTLPPGERRLYESEKLQQLRDRPLTASEFSGGLGSLSAAQREFVQRLSLTGVQGNTKRKGDVETVYYLVGDDRRAVRRFIETNEEFVAKAMATRSNKLSAEWDEFRYRLIQDEWRFYLCADQ